MLQNSKCFASGLNIVRRFIQRQNGLSETRGVNPVKLSYISYGPMKPWNESGSPPVIIAHGLLGSKSNWNTISKFLYANTNRRIISVDLRNHGDSPHTDEFSYRHMAADVQLLMEDLGLKSATLIGHGVGGRVMMLIALNNPELVENLILEEVSPVTSSGVLSLEPKLLVAMATVNLQVSPSLTATKVFTELYLSKYVHDEVARKIILSNIVDLGYGKFKWRVNIESIIKNFKRIDNFPYIFATFIKPTLIIGGGASNFMTPKEYVEIMKIFPTSKFSFIDGAKHFPHLENPKEFVETVRNFISKKK